jgi:hypothetical protein
MVCGALHTLTKVNEVHYLSYYICKAVSCSTITINLLTYGNAYGHPQGGKRGSADPLLSVKIKLKISKNLLFSKFGNKNAIRTGFDTSLKTLSHDPLHFYSP